MGSSGAEDSGTYGISSWEEGGSFVVSMTVSSAVASRVPGLGPCSLVRVGRMKPLRRVLLGLVRRPCLLSRLRKWRPEQFGSP